MDVFKNLLSPAPPGYRPIYRKWWFWVLVSPLILFMALVIYRIPVLMEQDRTREVVAQIHAQKLTIEDVNGEHLPPPPDPAQVDATIEGVDANGNGIRDDVELAIFEKYPNSARIRAAELQYAMALQAHLTLVSNGDLFVFATNLESLRMSCLKYDTIPSPNPSDSTEKWYQYYDKGDALIKEVENLVLSTPARRDRYNQIPKSKATSYFLAQNDPSCAIDPSLFPN